MTAKVLGKTVLEVFPFFSKRIVQEYKKVFKTGEELITEEESCVNGQTIITETRKIPLMEDKRVSKIITIIRNITERKKIEQAIEESEEKYRTLIEAVEDAIFFIEANEGYIESKDGKKIPVRISASGFDLWGKKIVLGIFRLKA
ncbi:MAG: PAS domain S-box protein [Candidatus Omnitrophica bacterium]|nr:PAS domain S-box protein [Candidatus Omnitrophota bacterium]